MRSPNVNGQKVGIWGKLSSFLRDPGATTAVEFALLIPVFMGASFMLLQVGLYQFYVGGISYATQKAARQILLGNVASGTNSSGVVSLSAFINSYLCPNLPPFMACANVVANVQTMNTQSTP